MTSTIADGRADLVAEFPLDSLSFGSLDMLADFWGETRRGLVFTSSDVMQIVR